MFLDKLLGRKSDKGSAARTGATDDDRPNTGDAGAPDPTRETLGLTSRRSGGSAGNQPVKKSKITRVSRAMSGRSARRGSNRVSHTTRSFAAPKRRPAGDRVFAYDILERAVVTEKSANASERGVHVFFVHRSADKRAIADAVETVYGARPRKVRVMNAPSKRKRVRVPGREREYSSPRRRKKAYVHLKDGDTIQLT